MESGKASSDLNQIHVPSSKQMPPHEYLRNTTLYIYMLCLALSQDGASKGVDLLGMET